MCECVGCVGFLSKVDCMVVVKECSVVQVCNAVAYFCRHVFVYSRCVECWLYKYVV